MTSDFNSQILGAIDNEWIPIGKRGGRFEFFKVRIYGSLHFVKRISPEYGNDLLSAESLRKEFTIGYPLNHPNIVRYLRFDGNAVYEEYIDGDTLRELIERNDKRLKSKEFVRKICIQILEALRYIHQQGILHLDLKPENIMITRVGEVVKVIDFGCSVNAANDSVPGYTQEYMAPEQLNSEVNTYTDIYQLGMIMKELVEIGGTKKKWKNFIRKAIASHPANRFRNDEEAQKTIPQYQKRRYRNIDLLMAILITGGLLSVIIINKTVTVSTLEETNETIEDQKLIGTDIFPDSIQLKEENSAKTSNPVITKPSEADLEREISSLISEKLTELYSEQVTPMYERMMEDKDKGIVQYSSQEFVDAYMRAYNRLVEYGDELGKKYPLQKDFIYEIIQKTFDIQTSRMREKLYPPANIKPSWEREIEITINQDNI